MSRVSTRRAVLAAAVWTVGPASVVALVRAGRIGPAALVLLLIVVHAAVEVIAWEVRDLRRSRARWRALSRSSAPLRDYCPQVEDRLYEEMERRSQSMHRPGRENRGAA